MLLEALLLLSLGDATEPPTKFRILKKGVNQTSKGSVIFDEKAAKLVLAAYAEHGAELFVDYEHKSILKTGAPVDGGKAAAWFKPAVLEGELWADEVQWTDHAKAALKAREYRYFSPAVLHDREGRVHKLVNVALTNLPATRQLRALVADDAPGNPTEKPHMELTEIELALFTALGNPKLTLAAALGQIQALQEEAAKVKTLSDKVAELELELAGGKVDKLLSDAKDAGKVSDAELPKLREQGVKDVQWLEGYLAVKTASSVAKPAHKPPKSPTGGEDEGELDVETLELSAADHKVIKLMGDDPAKFLETKKRLAKEDAERRKEAV